MPIRPENRSLYPKDWPAISKRIRFERAQSQCEWVDAWDQEDDSPDIERRCQAKHGERHPITGSKVILTVMHLDHDPTNCADGNLKAACQWHHNMYDREHRNGTRQKTMRARKNTLEMFEA
jgi:hypothetical protein